MSAFNYANLCFLASLLFSCDPEIVTPPPSWRIFTSFKHTSRKQGARREEASGGDTGVPHSCLLHPHKEELRLRSTFMFYEALKCSRMQCLFTTDAMATQKILISDWLKCPNCSSRHFLHLSESNNHKNGSFSSSNLHLI